MDDSDDSNLNLAGNHAHNININNNNDDSDEEVIEGMELLEGNYQVLRQWVPPAPNYWNAPPKAIIKSAEVRTMLSASSIENLVRYSEINTNHANEIDASFFVDYLLKDIFKSVFPHYTMHHDAGSSGCVSYVLKSDDGDGIDMDDNDVIIEDKRLQRWRETLEKRSALQRKIQKKTGKRAEEILFNRRLTIDERDKMMIQRLLEYARLNNKTTIDKSTLDLLDSYFNGPDCMQVNAVYGSKPQMPPLEIFGVPRTVQYELMDGSVAQAKSNWLTSEVLAQRVEQQEDSIARVLQFYPDVENLEVVPHADSQPPTIHQGIKLITMYDLVDISSDTEQLVEQPRASEDPHLPLLRSPLFNVKINGELYTTQSKRSASSAGIQLYFQCQPYQCATKVLIHLQNVGDKIMSFEWQNVPYYGVKIWLHKPRDSEFIFNTKSFMLLPKCEHTIKVLYRPRIVRMTKEMWFLKVESRLFCRRSDVIQVHLEGVCTMPHQAMQIIDNNLHATLTKLNYDAMKQTATLFGQLVPLIPQPEDICPYRRTFDVREVFNATNLGYHCTRYDDVERLRILHKLVKKPRERDWDFQIKTLQNCILRQTDVVQRKFLFAELNDILTPMMGPTQQSALIENTERDRARYIYVRGIIGSGIDDWETLYTTLRAQYFKTELANFLANLAENEDTDFVYAATPQQKQWTAELLPPGTLPAYMDGRKVAAHLLRKLNGSKIFRDALLMQTYTKICGIVENIVSVIESTEC